MDIVCIVGLTIPVDGSKLLISGLLIGHNQSDGVAQTAAVDGTAGSAFVFETLPNDSQLLHRGA